VEESWLHFPYQYGTVRMTTPTLLHPRVFVQRANKTWIFLPTLQGDSSDQSPMFRRGLSGGSERGQQSVVGSVGGFRLLRRLLKHAVVVAQCAALEYLRVDG